MPVETQNSVTIANQMKLMKVELIRPQKALGQQLQKIFEDLLGEKEMILHPSSRLKEDLGLDSLDMIELVMMIEKEFQVNLPDHQWKSVKNLEELEELVNSL